MKDVEDLRRSLEQRGVKMWAADGQLHIKARCGDISEDELSGIRCRRAEILEVLMDERALEDPILPRRPGRELPLTEKGMRAWQTCLQNGKRLAARLCADAMRLMGPLDVACLRESLTLLVQRHESLRTTWIANTDGLPRQQINPSGAAPVQMFDLSRIERSKAHDEVRRIAHGLTTLPIDLSAGPLFEACLFKITDVEHVLILVWAHAVTDYASIRIAVKELWDFYEQTTRRAILDLNPVLQFGDYAVWQQQTHNDWKRRHEQHWRDHLRDAPYVRIPRALPDVLQQSPQPSRHVQQLLFGEQLTSDLTATARRFGTSPSLIVLTIYAAVMWRWCNRDDLVIWLISSGRFRPELENVTGHVACRLPLRIRFERTDTFVDLLKRIESEVQRAESRRDFDRVPDLLPDCQLNYELFFNWTRAVTTDSRRRIDDLTIDPFDFAVEVVPEFVPTFRHLPSGICAKVSYRSDLFARSTIDRYLNQLRWFAQEFPGRVPRWR